MQQNLLDYFLSLLKEWASPLGVLALTFLGTKFVRVLIKRIGRWQRFSFLERLAPSLSNVLYLFGFRIFGEIAPLHPRVAARLEDAVYVLGVFVVVGLIRRSALSMIEWGTWRVNPSPAMQQGFLPLIQNLITLFVFLMTGIMILKHFNYDVMALLTALGVGSLAVGLAAKETLSNMISGFTLIIDRNLSPGDRINLGGYSGEVGTMGLRSTRIRLDDGNTLIVPNSELVNTKILNLSQPTRAMICDVNLKFSLDIPFQQIKVVCFSVMDEVAKTQKERPRSVHLSALVEGQQMIHVSFWVPEAAMINSAISEFHEKLLLSLAEKQLGTARCFGPVRQPDAAKD